MTSKQYKEIRHYPAECDVTCTNPSCHYIHIDTWYVVKTQRHYRSEAEAVAALEHFDKEKQA